MNNIVAFALAPWYSVRWRDGKEQVWVRVMEDPQAPEGDEAAERIVLCKSLPRRNKEQAIMSNPEHRFLEALQKLALRVQKKQLKERSKIQRAIGRIQARHTRVGRFYEVKLTDEAGELGLRWTRDDEPMEQAADLFGCYVLRTDERTLGEHELWKRYISLSRAENGFKALKTDLGLRPVYHHKEERVQAHILICFLALAMWRALESWLQAKGLGSCARQVLHEMANLRSMDVMAPLRGDREARMRLVGKPEKLCADLLKKMGLKLPTRPKIIQNVVEYRGTTVTTSSKIAKINPQPT